REVNGAHASFADDFDQSVDADAGAGCAVRIRLVGRLCEKALLDGERRGVFVRSHHGLDLASQIYVFTACGLQKSSAFGARTFERLEEERFDLLPAIHGFIPCGYGESRQTRSESDTGGKPTRRQISAAISFLSQALAASQSRCTVLDDTPST